MTGIIEMHKELRTNHTKPAHCKICAKLIKTNPRTYLTVNGTTYIGYVHESCLKQIYKVLVFNNLLGREDE